MEYFDPGIKKESFQKLWKAYQNREPFDIVGEKMMIRGVNISHPDMFPPHVWIKFDLGQNGILCFKAWDYDESWQE
jgi:hypothetical protein